MRKKGKFEKKAHDRFESRLFSNKHRGKSGQTDLTDVALEHEKKINRTRATSVHEVQPQTLINQRGKEKETNRSFFLSSLCDRQWWRGKLKVVEKSVPALLFSSSFWSQFFFSRNSCSTREGGEKKREGRVSLLTRVIQGVCQQERNQHYFNYLTWFDFWETWCVGTIVFILRMQDQYTRESLIPIRFDG